MARKRMAPRKDSAGRWRDPQGHFTSAPVRRKSAKSVTKKEPAKPAPAPRAIPPSPTSVSGSLQPRTPGRKGLPPRPAPPPPALPVSWLTGKPVEVKPHARGWLAGWVPPAPKPVLPDRKKRRGPRRVKQKPPAAPPPARIPQRPLDARGERSGPGEAKKAAAAAKVEAEQAAEVAAAVAKRSKEARARVEQPKFQALHPEDVKKLERAVTREEDAAEELRMHALDKQREWEKLFREAADATALATKNRRLWARGQRVAELEALKDQKLTPWEMRKARAEVLGLTPGQAIGKPEPGKITYTQLRHMEIVMREARRRSAEGKEGLTKRGEALRKALYDRGLRSPEAMAAFFADVGMQEHDGYVLYFRY